MTTAPAFTRTVSTRAADLAVTIDIALSTNPDGFTLTPIGFHLLGSKDDVYMPSGYAVGGIIPSLTARPNPRGYVSALDKIATWAERYWTVRDALPLEDIYVGGWLDSETQTVYVDAVLILPDLDIARTYARLNGEIAIGHFKDGKYMETIQVTE